MYENITRLNLLVFICFAFSVLPIRSTAYFKRNSPEDALKIVENSTCFKGGLAEYAIPDGGTFKLKDSCDGLKTLFAFQLSDLPKKMLKMKKIWNVKFRKNATSVQFTLRNSSRLESRHMTSLPEISVKISNFAVHIAAKFGKEFHGNVIIGDETKICSCFKLHVKSYSHSRRRRFASNYPCAASQRISRAVVVLNVAYVSLSSQERQAIMNRMASYAAVSLNFIDIVMHTGFIYVFYPATLLEFLSGDNTLTVANSTVSIVLNDVSHPGWGGRGT